MLKIAISGYAGCGKNTATDIIIKNILNFKYGEFYISAFADRIKEIIQMLFPGCDPEALYGDSKLRQNRIFSELDTYSNNAINVSFRQVLLDLGKLGRSYHPWFWVWNAQHQYNKILKDPVFAKTKAYMIVDVRFPEEYQWLKSEGFVICRIKRNEITKINDISEYIQEQLPDEMFDIVINNNGSIMDFENKLKSSFDNYFYNNKVYLQARDGIR